MCGKQAIEKKGSVIGLGALALVLILSVFFVRPVAAGDCPCNQEMCCVMIPYDSSQGMPAYHEWISSTFFSGYFKPKMKSMTKRFINTGFMQVIAVGAMFDAKQQLEAQLVIQQLKAKAHKDYYPSTDICTIGTSAELMEGGASNGRFNAMALADRSLDRHLGRVTAGAGEGPGNDRDSRVEQFLNLYCDRGDNDNGFASICSTSVTEEKKNKDIDYSRTIDGVWTIDADYTTAWGDDMPDVFALANNLYGHDVFTRPTRQMMANQGNQEAYLDARSLIAQRSVAENSFQSIVALKSAGTEGSVTVRPYLEGMLRQLGMEEGAMDILGERPSYYAQLELMGQRIYQNAGFFASLYDTPVNVMRKEVAMQGVELMLDREMFESELRYEMMLAVMLETALVKKQDELQNRMLRLNDRGKER